MDVNLNLKYVIYDSVFVFHYNRLSTEDQENLRQHVEKWKVEMPDDRFHFVPRYSNQLLMLSNAHICHFAGNAPPIEAISAGAFVR